MVAAIVYVVDSESRLASHSAQSYPRQMSADVFISFGHAKYFIHIIYSYSIISVKFFLWLTLNNAIYLETCIQMLLHFWDWTSPTSSVSQVSMFELTC